MNAIEAQALTKAYGRARVVQDLHLEVPSGIVFGYLGPNGAGKTTTIRMLTGVLAPTSGHAVVAGVPLRRPDELKARIGYASQGASVYLDLSVAQNLAFKASLFLAGRDVNAAVDRALDRLGLTSRRAQLAGRLSGGWRQRLSIATAIVHDPSVLFLDEPTAGLDPVGRRELWDAIYDLAGEGTTVFVTTHYMDEAERCQAIAMISGGRVLAAGEPDAIRAAAPGRFYEVDAADPGAALRVARRDARVRDAWINGSRLRLATSEPLDRAFLATLGTNAREVPPSLEDAFVALAAADGGRSAS